MPARPRTTHDTARRRAGLACLALSLSLLFSQCTPATDDRAAPAPALTDAALEVPADVGTGNPVARESSPQDARLRVSPVRACSKRAGTDADPGAVEQQVRITGRAHTALTATVTLRVTSTDGRALTETAGAVVVRAGKVTENLELAAVLEVRRKDRSKVVCDLELAWVAVD